MPDLVAIEIITDNLAEHHAVRAWSELRPKRVEPTAIETLARRRKTAIYKLHGVGPAGTAVIAKRTLTETALTEHTIYQEILPELPMPALGCYGVVEEQTPEYRWLFLEDAGPEAYIPALAEHRAAGARWLARLHTSAPLTDTASRLPARGSEFYLEQLRQARANIVSSFGNRLMKDGERAVLKEVIEKCDLVESHWERVECLCEGVTPTFVHGDLKPKNIRVRRIRGKISLLAFDWELAGWGVPAPDVLKCADLQLYWEEVRQCWPELKFSQVQQLAGVGALFRALIAMFWESLALRYDEVQWPVDKIRIYLERLNTATQCLGINCDFVYANPAVPTA